jgi:hypothetical protein
MMNWKGHGRKRSWPNLKLYPVVCLEGLRKPTKNLSQYSPYPDRSLNLGPLEYESAVFVTKC